MDSPSEPNFILFHNIIWRTCFITTFVSFLTRLDWQEMFFVKSGHNSKPKPVGNYTWLLLLLLMIGFVYRNIIYSFLILVPLA